MRRSAPPTSAVRPATAPRCAAPTGAPRHRTVVRPAAPRAAGRREPRDVVSLPEHFALTLRHWGRRLEARHAEAAGQVGEDPVRIWRLYMAAAARASATGGVGVVQALLSKPDAGRAAGLPLTRADLHSSAPGRSAPQPGPDPGASPARSAG